MNNVLIDRRLLLSIIVALLCITLLVGALLIHESVGAMHLGRQGIMIIQTQGRFV